jgi:hypothetical protein
MSSHKGIGVYTPIETKILCNFAKNFEEALKIGFHKIHFWKTAFLKLLKDTHKWFEIPFSQSILEQEQNF